MTERFKLEIASLCSGCFLYKTMTMRIVLLIPTVLPVGYSLTTP